MPNTWIGGDLAPESRRDGSKIAQGDVSETNETLGIKIENGTRIPERSEGMDRLERTIVVEPWIAT